MATTMGGGGANLECPERTKLSRSRKEFVAFDAGSHAMRAVLGFNTDHTRIAADIHVPGQRDLLREREHKFNGASSFQIGCDREIESAEAYVARFSLPLGNTVSSRKANLYGKIHRKTPSRSPLHIAWHDLLFSGTERSSYHRYPRGAMDFPKREAESQKSVLL